MKLLFAQASLYFLIAVVSSTALNAAVPNGWKLFSSRAGWEIGYPADWKPTGCSACEDLEAPDNSVVMFQPPTYNGLVRVEKLGSKPAEVDDRTWLLHFKTTNSRDTYILETHPATVNGMAALDVIYSAPSTPPGKGTQHEIVFVTARGTSYAIIVFSPLRIRITDPITPVRQLDIYPTFRRMLSSFRIVGTPQ